MESRMSFADRFFRSAFVALAVGLGWGIRGDFGHQLGAMVPGALLGLGYGFVSGQERAFRRLPLLGFIGAVTMSMGGTMSYGTLHGYCNAPDFANYAYGFLTVFLCAGVWGGPCGAGIALLLEREPLKLREWVACVLTVLLWAVASHAIVVNMIGFRVNPPRSDISIAFVGGMGGLFYWLYRNDKRFGLKGALYGFIGFGVAMTLARFIANVQNMDTKYLQFVFDNWKIMEIGSGIFGGFFVTYALLGKEFPEKEPRPWASAVGYVGLFFVMVGIPLLHWVQRIPYADTKTKVASSAAQLWIKDGDALVKSMQYAALPAIQVLALIGAVIWLGAHYAGRRKYMAFPVLWFGLVMLLTSNVRSTFPFMYPSSTSFRVQAVFWILFLLMVVFGLFWKPRPVLLADDLVDRIRWKWAGGVTAVVFLLMVGLSHFVNEPKPNKPYTGDERFIIRTAQTR